MLFIKICYQNTRKSGLHNQVVLKVLYPYHNLSMRCAERHADWITYSNSGYGHYGRGGDNVKKVQVRITEVAVWKQLHSDVPSDQSISSHNKLQDVGAKKKIFKG